MHLHADRLYHIYNRGNNRKLLFYEERNYTYFLSKVKLYIAPYCDLLEYCLLPNHFHFLIHATEKTVAPWRRRDWDATPLDTNSNIHMTQFAHGLQMLLSSYAKAMNHQYKRTGSLFTQNTRAKETSSDMFSLDYSLWCFMYIHNNPVLAGLVSSPEKWRYSSYREYLGKGEENICNIEVGKKLLNLNINQLSSFDNVEIPDHIINKIK